MFISAGCPCRTRRKQSNFVRRSANFFTCNFTCKNIALANSWSFWMTGRPDHLLRLWGSRSFGTAVVLFHAFVKKHLTLAELEDAVEALRQTIWLAPSVVADALKKAREADR